MVDGDADENGDEGAVAGNVSAQSQRIDGVIHGVGGLSFLETKTDAEYLRQDS